SAFRSGCPVFADWKSSGKCSDRGFCWKGRPRPRYLEGAQLQLIVRWVIDAAVFRTAGGGSGCFVPKSGTSGGTGAGAGADADENSHGRAGLQRTGLFDVLSHQRLRCLAVLRRGPARAISTTRRLFAIWAILLGERSAVLLWFGEGARFHDVCGGLRGAKT